MDPVIQGHLALTHEISETSAKTRIASLDYARVSRYWNNARPSVLGPYMMDGFGFPAGAGHYRFRAECEIVDRLIQGIDRDGTVLDIGSGIGYWTEHFARAFRNVVSVEASTPLFEALRSRCDSYANVRPIHGDVKSFQPQGRFDLAFLGGMLMYLNAEDVVSLLRKLVPLLNPRGIILCRESTVRTGTTTRQGEYQVVYRSCSVYARLFETCGFSVEKVEMNRPYVLLQMGCEAIRKWKAMVPESFQAVPIMGRFAYWALRLGAPWITSLPAALKIPFPKLTNHFFVLRKKRGTTEPADGPD